MSEHVVVPAELRLLSESNGGRATAMRSGYRSIVRIGAADAEPAWGVEITFEEPDSLAPGASASVMLDVWALGEAPDPGTRFWLFEGARPVGDGVMT